MQSPRHRKAPFEWTKRCAGCTAVLWTNKNVTPPGCLILPRSRTQDARRSQKIIWKGFMSKKVSPASNLVSWKATNSWKGTHHGRSRAALWQGHARRFVAASGGPASGRYRVGARSGARAVGGAGNHRRSLPHGNGGRPAVYGHPRGRFHAGALGGRWCRGQRRGAGRGGPCGHGGVQAPAYARGDRALRSAAGSRLQGVACGKS